MADYALEQMEEGGRYWPRPGRSYSRDRVYRDPFNATCQHCGMTGLKWRAEAEGWRLFENERIEHNRLKPHDCRSQCSADDFDVIED